MQLIYSCLIFAFIMIVPISGQSCSCFCGSVSYYPSFNCSSATSCAIICNSNYGACTNLNTYGCCGSSCTYYSSIVRCNCLCSGSNSGSLYSVGSISVNQCTTGSCKSSCSTTYPSTCGRYINKSYCSHAMSKTETVSMFVILFNLIIAICFA